MTDSAAKATTRSGVERLAVGAVSTAFALAQIIGYHDLRHDDAFISFRYGQNLALGRGLVFNPGGRTMGSTSPADTLVSAFAHTIVGDEMLPSVMSALGCIAWTAAALAVYALMRKPCGLAAAAASALLFACGITEAGSWVALETNWAVAFALWSLWAATEKRWQLAAALAALGTWTRPDTLLVAIPIAILAFRHIRWRALRPAATYILAVIPWYIFAWAKYGDPLPQSLRAKAATDDLIPYASHLLSFVPGVVLPWLPAFFLWCLAIAGWVVLVRRARSLAALAAYGGLVAVAYLVMRPGTMYSWHLQPLVVVFAFGLVGGAATYLARVRQRSVRWAGAAVGAVLLIVVARESVLRAGSHQDAVYNGQRHRVYTDVSAFLVAHSNPGDGVSHEEVGTIAYLTDLPMNDRTGLVTRHPGESLRRFMAGEPTKLRWLILRKPELEPAREIYGRRQPLVFRRGQFRVFVFDLNSGMH